MTDRNILTDAAYLFDFGFPMRRFDVTSIKTGKLDDLSWELSNLYTLPKLDALSVENDRNWIMRGAWHERGFMFEMEVDRLPDPSVGPVYHRSLQIFIDTRGSYGIKRANHFCYRLNFSTQQPPAKTASQIQKGRNVAILKANEEPPKIPDEDLLFMVGPLNEKKELWRVLVKGAKLHGFNPVEFPEIGFFFCMYDSKSISIHIARTSSSRFQEDPSHWCRVKLV